MIIRPIYRVYTLLKQGCRILSIPVPCPAEQGIRIVQAVGYSSPLSGGKKKGPPQWRTWMLSHVKDYPWLPIIT